MQNLLKVTTIEPRQKLKVRELTPPFGLEALKGRTPQSLWRFPSAQPDFLMDYSLWRKLEQSRMQTDGAGPASFLGWQSVMEEDATTTPDEFFTRLSALIGSEGMKPAGKREAMRYREFLSQLNFPYRFPSNRKMAKALLTDLGSMIDIAVIHKGSRRDFPRRIIEIGGGYGRLVEAYFSNVSNRIQWFMLDAVPSSLVAAWGYLGRISGLRLELHLPHETISAGSRYSDAQVHLVPSWNYELVEGLFGHGAEVYVNVESFQEMPDKWIKRWLTLIDSSPRHSRSLFLESNSRDYVNTNLESLLQLTDWRLEYSANTPRSWTVNHPTNLFVRDSSTEN